MIIYKKGSMTLTRPNSLFDIKNEINYEFIEKGGVNN